MSIFDGKPIEMNTKLASHMTDMSGFYPVQLIKGVNNKLERGLEILCHRSADS